MPFPTRLTKRTSKLVSTSVCFIRPIPTYTVELDALELDVEEEGPSYLSDLNKVPDFVDEPPVEIPEVSHTSLCDRRLLLKYASDPGTEGSCQDIGIDAQADHLHLYHISVPSLDVLTAGSQCTLVSGAAWHRVKSHLRVRREDESTSMHVASLQHEWGVLEQYST